MRDRFSFAVALASSAVFFAACGDPFVQGIDYECSAARGIACQAGYSCESNWCVRICTVSFDCPGANEACIEELCVDYSATCGDAEDPPCANQWFCDGSVCHKLLDLGQLCGGDRACESGACVDSVCCENACDGVCESCAAAPGDGADGQCVLVPEGTDPDDECGLATCDGAGACLSIALGDECSDSFECASGNCADGVCCAAPCDGACEACSSAGACEPIPADTDPEDECSGVTACTGSRSCHARQPGDVCTEALQCASGFCRDGVCCDDECAGTCQTCSANVLGECSAVISGSDADTCGSAVAAGVCAAPPCACDGVGACAQAPGTLCADATPCGGFPCLGGVCCADACAGTCMSCNDDDTAAGNGTCAPVSAGLDPRDECLGVPACDGAGACYDLDIASPCESDFQCANGLCTDGVCCAVPCDATCYACDGVATSALPGTCAAVDEGQDPLGECSGYAACNGAAGCYSGGPGSACSFGHECTSGTCASALCSTVAQVAVGGFHTCARLSNGQVKCWGHNFSGTLGIGDTVDRGEAAGDMGDGLSIVLLGTGRTATAIAAGDVHSCALLDNGQVKCWGDNGNGRLGQGDTAIRGDAGGEMGDNLPAIALGTGRTATAIATGGAHSCALLDNGQVKCWGNNGAGQLGLGTTAARGDGPGEMGDSLPPVDLGTGRTATTIAAGATHTCAMLDNGQVKCWGDNANGKLGLGNTSDRGDAAGEMGDNLIAVALGTGRTATQIALGVDHSCARLDNGQVKCWGGNSEGQLGLGDTLSRGDASAEMGDSLPAIALGVGRTATAISAGTFHTCAKLDNDQVKCWGYAAYGQLGLGNTIDRGDGSGEMGDGLASVSIGTGRSAASIDAGGSVGGASHTCATLDNGQVKCWGSNSDGQLGIGDSISRGDNADEMGDTLPEIDL